MESTHPWSPLFSDRSPELQEVRQEEQEVTDHKYDPTKSLLPSVQNINLKGKNAELDPDSIWKNYSTLLTSFSEN